MPRTIVMSCGDADASGAAPGSPVVVLPIGSLMVELDFVAGPRPVNAVQVGLHIGRVKKFHPGRWIFIAPKCSQARDGATGSKRDALAAKCARGQQRWNSRRGPFSFGSWTMRRPSGLNSAKSVV